MTYHSARHGRISSQGNERSGRQASREQASKQSHNLVILQELRCCRILANPGGLWFRRHTGYRTWFWRSRFSAGCCAVYTIQADRGCDLQASEYHSTILVSSAPFLKPSHFVSRAVDGNFATKSSNALTFATRPNGGKSRGSFSAAKRNPSLHTSCT